MGVGPVGAVPGGAEVSVVRFAGGDRYATSLAAAEAVAADAGGRLGWLVVVSGQRWTDAVAAAPLAGRLGGAVLMSPPGELRADAAEFIGRVGVEQLVVVGPSGSGGGAHGEGRGVSGAVMSQLRALGVSAQRVAGDSVYGTAVAVARRVGEAGTLGGGGRTAVVASGTVFADALVAGPFAARGGHPVLLTPPEGLDAEVAGFLGEGGVDSVVVMGGTAAVSQAVRDEIEALGIGIVPVSGVSRFDTAVKAAELVQGAYSDAAGRPCFSSATVGVARARVPFDSFSAAPLLARLCAPLLLAEPDRIPAETAGYINAANAVRLRVFGGDAAVSQAALADYLGDAAPISVSLSPGACGGDADDPPSRLIDDPESEDPAWSPDCTEIAYSVSGRLWVAGRDGTDARQIAGGSGSWAYSPAWSPDGEQIAFSRGGRDDDGHWFKHIYLIDADGTGRTKLSKGDVRDDDPSWSPDGQRIVFERTAGSGRDDDGDFIDTDRHLVIIDADGRNVVKLKQGGRWEHDPIWSPDGERLAYEGSGGLRVMSPDGTGDRAIGAADAWWRGGVAWSPDGSRIAYVQQERDPDGGSVAGTGRAFAVEVGGLGRKQQITDLDGWVSDLSWSPDGQRIAFAHYDHSYSEDPWLVRYASTVGAAGTPVRSGAETCKPLGKSWGTTAGFPLPDWTAPSSGVVRVAVLFVDFPDAQATYSTQQEAERGLPWAEEYLEAMSYGKLDVQYVPRHEWIRAPKSYREYLEENAIGSLDVGGDIYQDAVNSVDDEIDFTTFHSLAVILPSTHFTAGAAGGRAEADGVRIVAHKNNDTPKSETGEMRDWGSTAAHELAHNLGLADLYPYDDAHERSDAPAGREWVMAELGLMDLRSWFLADASQMLTRVTNHHADGSSEWFESGALRPREMLAWSRWQLGWLSGTQVRCVHEPATTVELTAIGNSGAATAMAAVPLSRNEVIVVESRRKAGYDLGSIPPWRRGGSVRRPALIEEGILVYTVDTSLGSGDLPIKVAGDSGNGQVDDFPVLEVGESVTVRGYTVTLTADDGDTHRVTIVRN